jgi:hypothetical protein
MVVEHDQVARQYRVRSAGLRLEAEPGEDQLAAAPIDLAPGNR